MWKWSQTVPKNFSNNISKLSYPAEIGRLYPKLLIATVSDHLLRNQKLFWRIIGDLCQDQAQEFFLSII